MSLTLLMMILLFLGAAGLVIAAVVRAVHGANRYIYEGRINRLVPVADPTAPEWAVRLSDYQAAQRRDLRQVLQKVTGIHYLEDLEKDLVGAEVSMRASEFLLLRVAAVALPVLVLGPILGRPYLAVLAGLLGFWLPVAWLQTRARRRLAKFNGQLADFLLLVVNALRSGQTFLQGVHHAAQSCPDPIAREFRQVLHETNLGKPVGEALEAMIKRVPSEDLEIAVTAFDIQKNVGGNLADVLENVASAIRERVKLAGLVKTLTAQGMLSGIIVGVLPVAVGFMIYLINPPSMEVFFTHPVGTMFLFVAALLELFGAFLIRRIVRIEL